VPGPPGDTASSSMSLPRISLGHTEPTGVHVARVSLGSADPTGQHLASKGDTSRDLDPIDDDEDDEGR
jgi:hypothetical protein